MVRYFTHGTTLAYRTYGSGPLPLLAFHGFGRTGEDFAILEEVLGARVTIHAFDLHFHGQSPGYPDRADTPFTPDELAGYFSAFTDHIGAGRVLLLGYSLGGRIALSLAERMPGRLARVFLAAPDGLKTRPWYRGLAASSMGRKLYGRFVHDPRVTHAIINALRRTRLLSEKMHRFLIGQTDSRAKRQLVHDVWLSYRLIEPDLARVTANLREHHIPLYLFFGERDRIIRPAFGKALLAMAPQQVTRELLPFGHVLISPELGRAMEKYLE